MPLESTPGPLASPATKGFAAAADADGVAPAIRGVGSTPAVPSSAAGCGWQNATAADLECPGSHVTGTCVAEGFTERNVYAIFGFCCKLAAFS